MEIFVRHIEPEDYEAMHRIMTGPVAHAGTLQLPLQSKESWRGKLAEPPPGLYSLVACLANSGEVVGSGSLATHPERARMRHVGGLGMVVRDDWRGRGVGTRLMQSILDLSDNWLGLTRVELEVFTDNEAAVALYSKFGFEVEGTLRRKALRNGEYVDCFAMARLKS